MNKHIEIFWIQFAGLYCRTKCTKGMKMIITKYFSGSYVSISDQEPASLDHIAKLTIYQKEAELGKTSVNIENRAACYVMHIEGSAHFYYPLLTNVIQRIFMELFYKSGGIVLHASAVVSQGKAHIFVGESGRGKTTIARLSGDIYRMPIISDNQAYIRKHRGTFVIYPFPFTQYNKDGYKAYYPIAAVYILHQASSFALKTLPFMERLEALVHEIQILSAYDVPAQAQGQAILRRIIFDFAKLVTIKRLYFMKKRGFWEAIERS